MKMYLVLLLPLVILFGCNGGDNQHKKPDSTTNSFQPATDATNQQLTERYQNDRFQFSISLPARWQVVEKNDSDLGFAVNFFPPGSEKTRENAPLNVHAPAGLSFISIWPQGYGIELPFGEMKKFPERSPGVDLPFAADKENSRVFLLEDGTPWAFFIVPANQPANWNHGFVFAQLATDNFKATCYDNKTGKPKALEDCDPMGGDRFVRLGAVNPNQAAIIDSMLASIKFSENVASGPGAMIRVDHPSPNEVISSPVQVAGEARGNWFFEANFLVSLYDANNQKLADGIATATGNWMTENFVPFSTTLTYKPPDDARGYLVLKKANPSGLQENESFYTLPVNFSSKSTK